MPGGECASQADCVLTLADGIHYNAQFWPIPLPGWGDLSGAKWNVSVQSGVDAVNAPDAYPAAVATGNDIVIFGYSQGATVASLIKAQNEGDAASAGRLTSSSGIRSVRMAESSSGLPSLALFRSLMPHLVTRHRPTLPTY